MPSNLVNTILTGAGGQPISPQPVLTVDLAGNYVSPSGGSSVVTQPTATNLNAQVVGNTPASNADSGNPVKVGGVFNTTLPSYSSGQRSDIQSDLNGNLRARLIAGSITPTDGVINTSLVSVSLPAEQTPAVPRPLLVTSYVFNGTTWDRQRGDTSGTYTVNAPSVAASVGLVPVRTSALASSLTLKSGAGNLYRFTVSNQAVTAAWIMVFDATSAPADGAVTPIWTKMVAASSSADFNFDTIPLRFSTGCTVVLSTTGPFTKTASVNAFIAGLVA